jgi:hypothetical protein
MASPFKLMKTFATQAGSLDRFLPRSCQAVWTGLEAAQVDRIFFVSFEDGMWLIKSGNQYIGGCQTREEALAFAIRKAESKGISTQVLLAGKDRLFQTVWAGGKAYSAVH